MTKAKAMALAKKAKSMLDNPRGWKLDVWENLGWHVALRKGGMNLYVRQYMGEDKLSFSTLFSTDESSSGEIFWSNDFTSSNPNKVIERQLKIAQSFVKKCQRAIDKVA